ncbi:MAG: hypothetical protein JWM36_4365 [Hyphomicrobiales bacterium]|nr:hypothetical protein [Hyphomicrobiales bacterium]
MKGVEDNLQASIVAYLRVCVPSHIVFAVPNGGLRTKAQAGILRATGQLAGVPDLCLIGPCGVARFLEVKTEKGVLNKDQKAILNLFMNMSVQYAVVRSIDDVKAALASWRIPTRETA